jgi:restriction system protein
VTAVWGIHNDALSNELVDEGFVSVGWENMPDLRTIGNDRAQMKAALERLYPEAKAGAIPVWAGILIRFAFDIQPGDIVIAPYRADSTLNFGVVTGDYEYSADVAVHPHRRKVRWTKTGVSRGLFPQKALYEIGSALTLFRVKSNVGVFQDFLKSHSDQSFEATQKSVAEDVTEDWVEDEPSAARLDQFTNDFLLKTLLQDLSHEEFEHFTADLLRAMGYQARVTPFTSDGGVDVIAHRDPLGLEPPQIKVQCKHTSSQQSRPDVQRLSGTLAQGELGLFVCLGSFSKDALGYERERQNLRLLTGTEVVEMTLRHYDKLSSKWRARMPLRQVYVVDRSTEGR